VRENETIDSVIPEAPVPSDANSVLTPVSAYEFVQRWITARSELSTHPRPI
jgi:hypothetical protein